MDDAEEQQEEEEMKQEAWPIITMPSCQLDNWPDFVFGSLPSPFASPVYAPTAISSLSARRRGSIGPWISRYYVGVMDPITQRPWSFSIGTPRCFVTFQTSQSEKHAPNTRALVCPMYGDGQNPNVEPFLIFVNHLSALGMRCDVSDWMSPVREENSFIIGVPANVKSDHVRQVVLNGGGSVVCCLKLFVCTLPRKEVVCV